VTLLILARHGETDWNRDGIWQGHGDPPLNPLGRQQAAGLRRRLAGLALDAIYASDLTRARETAEIVAAARGMMVVLEPGVREVDVGSWTGLTWEQIEERFPGVRDHDGEARDAFRARVLDALQRIAGAHDGGTVLVVTHGGVIRTLDRVVFGEPRPLPGNCEVCLFRFREGNFAAVD
jgi:broad specificity phosphatase PhoE